LLDLPLRFEPNKGQMDERIRFLARGGGFGLYLTREGATLALRRESIVSMRVIGGRRDVEPVGSETQEGVTNYFVGNDPARWRTGVEGYARVCYPGVLPGVDLVYYGTGQRRLEYDLVLAPGTDPKSVALTFDGASAVTLGVDGSAVIHVGGGTIVQPAPVAYQVSANGDKQLIDVRYRRQKGGLGFTVGAYDAGRRLVIDPTLAYSTYLGGSNNDVANAIAVDAAGEVFVAGETSSTDFPTAAPFQAISGGSGLDAFVTKLNAAGSALVYSTYLGGNGSTLATAIALDRAGEAFVAGYTVSTNYPTAAPFQAVNAGSDDGFVTKLSATGSALVYSSYLGGTNSDTVMGIALDTAGNAYVTGSTASTNFPTNSPLQAFNKGGIGDAFVSKINASGSGLVYSTYLGGSQDDSARAIAVDGAGEAFVTGSTNSINTPGCSGCSDFPTASAFQPAGAGFGTVDAFVAKLNAGGSALVFSTYLGGNHDDRGTAIAIDGGGEAFVTGSTNSSDFPVFKPFQASPGGPAAINAFVTKFNAAGTGLVYSTYLGGSNDDEAAGIAVDHFGDAVVTGFSFSTDFPTLSPWQAALAGSLDVFVTKLNPAGAGLLYSTYLGGGGPDRANGIALDATGAAYVVGSTSSTNFPTASPFQASNHGFDDAFVAKLAGLPAPVPAARWPFIVAVAFVLLALGSTAAVRDVAALLTAEKGAGAARLRRGVARPRRRRTSAVRSRAASLVDDRQGTSADAALVVARADRVTHPERR
jgi:hypothetical protein